MAQLNFDATQVAPDQGFDTVPAGWYNVMVDESEMKPTSAGDGAYLNVRFNIMDGQFAGRKLFARLNIQNANPTAKEIAYKQLSAIAHAVGVLHVADSQQLHGIPLKVRVKIRKDATGQYDDQNDITAFRNINDQVGGAQGGAPAGGQAAHPPAAAPAYAAPAQPPAAPAGAQPWGGAPSQPWAQPGAAQPPAGAPAGAPPAGYAQPPATEAPPAWQAPPAAAPAQQAPAQAAQPQPPAQQAPTYAPAGPAAAASAPPVGAAPPWGQPQQ